MKEPAKKKNENQLVRSNRLEWRPLPEENAAGVFVKSLLFDERTRRSPTFLLKFEASVRYPLHRHPQGEEIFVLEGDIRLGKDHLFAGDYLFTAPDNSHAVRTDGGCTILIRVPEPVEIIAPRRS